MFIPTGANAEAMLGRVLKAKPLVALIGKEAKNADDDNALFSRSQNDHTSVVENVKVSVSSVDLDRSRSIDHALYAVRVRLRNQDDGFRAVER